MQLSSESGRTSELLGRGSTILTFSSLITDEEKEAKKIKSGVLHFCNPYDWVYMQPIFAPNGFI